MVRIALANTAKITLAPNTGTATLRPGDSSGAAASAAAAAASAAAAIAVGSTNDTIIAGRVNDSASATRAAANKVYARGVSVTDPQFGAVADYNSGTGAGTDNGSAFQACATACAAFGASMWIPAGAYKVNTTVAWPTQLEIRGEGIRNTHIVRTADVSVFTATGLAWDGTSAFFPTHYGAKMSDLSIQNSAVSSSSPLVKILGAAGMHWSRVQLESYNDGPTLLETTQMFDSRFDNCLFHGGGSATGPVGAVRLLADYGTGTTYKQTKEIVFEGCWWESYFGPAVQTARGGSSYKPELLTFSNCKMESYTTTSHLALVANHVKIGKTYITHKATTGAVMDLQDVRGLAGDVEFVQVTGTGAVAPSACIDFGTGSTRAQFVNLDINVGETQMTSANVLTMDSTTVSDATVTVRMNAREPLINGVNTRVHTFSYSNIRQSVTSGTTTCQYTWARTGRPEWSLGNPTNPSSTLEDIYLRSNTTNFLTFRSAVADPSVGPRSIIFNAAPILTSAWNGVATLNLGSYQFFLDANGVLRRKTTAPTADTDGTVSHSMRAVTTLSGSGGILSRDDFVVATGSGITVTLPSAATVGVGKEYTIKATHASGANVATTSSQTIDGAAGPIALAQYARMTVVSDGTNWLRVD